MLNVDFAMLIVDSTLLKENRRSGKWEGRLRSREEIVKNWLVNAMVKNKRRREKELWKIDWLVKS